MVASDRYRRCWVYTSFRRRPADRMAKNRDKSGFSIGITIGVPSLAMAMALGGCTPAGLKGADSSSHSVFSMFSPPSPQTAAAWAIDPYDADKRQRGILLLANEPWGGEKVYLDLYIAALNDGDAGVRISAIKALGLHGDPADAPLIAERLSSEDHLERWTAANALQRLHNPEVVPTLLEHLDPKKEQEFDVRASVATALGQYPEGRVVDGLIPALDDMNLLVNIEADKSLHTLTGQEFGQDVRAWVEWTKEADNLFAGQLPYTYPVFQRDKTMLEWVLPFMQPPNEVAAAPAGMPPVQKQARSAGSTETEDESVRQN